MRREGARSLGRRHGIADPQSRQSVDLGKAARDDHAAVVHGPVDERRVVRRLADVVMIGLVDQHHDRAPEACEETPPDRPPRDAARRIVRIADVDQPRVARRYAPASRSSRGRTPGSRARPRPERRRARAHPRIDVEHRQRGDELLPRPGEDARSRCAGFRWSRSRAPPARARRDEDAAIVRRSASASTSGYRPAARRRRCPASRRSRRPRARRRFHSGSAESAAGRTSRRRTSRVRAAGVGHAREARYGETARRRRVVEALSCEKSACAY